MPSRVGADDARGGPGVGEIVDASGNVRGRAVPLGNRSVARKTARFAEPVSAPRGSGNVVDDDDDAVEITLDMRDYTAAVHRVRPVARSEDPGVKLLARTPEKWESSSGYGALKNTTMRIQQETRRVASLKRRGGGFDRSMPSAPARALEGLKFVSGTDASDGWTDAERFYDRNARLPRSMFGQCIGVKEAAFAGELFDTLGRRQRISGDSIDKAELREFWDQISHPSYESRLQLFFDMVDKDADGRINQVEFKQIITLSASVNQLTVAEQDSEECARLIMEKLDPNGLGYIELYDLETILVKLSTTTNGDEEPNPLRRWYRHARYFLKDNWRPCWVASLNRRGGGFDKSMPSAPARALEGLKFVSGTDASDGWTDAERFYDRNARLPRSMFGQCIGVKEAAFAGELFDTLGRQRRISGDSIDKAELLEFWDQISDRSYVGRLQLFFDMVDKDSDGRISQVEFKQIITLSASANKLKVGEQDSEECARLIMEKLDPDGLGYIETWMYLAVPMIVYACERLTRTLRSRVRAVHKVKAVVHPDPAALLSLHLSKPEGFRYKSGQYIFVKCPNVSSFEWHPFSITSAPEDDYVSVHIKAMGDWTKDLRDAFFKVCEPLTEEKKTEILRIEYDHDKAMPTLGGRLKYPTVLIDGPYGAPAQDYKQYETLLLVGLGIGATPMISIIKDIINNMKRLPGDIESGNPSDGSMSSSFRTRRAYFYWITREQESLEWFHGIMDEVAETDKQGVIELHVHCTSVHEEGDARSAVITVAQSLNHDKHGIDIISGTRVKTSFGRANWREVYRHIARQNRRKHVGVFYCGMPALTKELRELAKLSSRETSTTFEFHKENF
ncbi:hypothetical protein ACQJBY_007570 [Aegilops geniculata]